MSGVCRLTSEDCKNFYEMHFFNIYISKVEALPQLFIECASQTGQPKSSEEEFAVIQAKGLAAGELKSSILHSIKRVTIQVQEEAQLGSQAAYADSVRLVLLTSIAFGVIACTCCALMPNIKNCVTQRSEVDIH